MTVCLLCIGDGRDEVHEHSWASAQLCLPPWDRKVVVDDRDHSLGFAGAIQAGWQEVLDTGADWVVHLEMDFVFNAPVPVGDMIEVLDQNRHLAQMALKRQPWNEEEKAAGGIVECHPEDFTQQSDGLHVWTEHRRFFTTNPSVYSAKLCAAGWPQQPESEGRFTHALLDIDPKLRFAFWGGKFAPPLVEHIGEVRAGVGY